jgi:phosphatidylinositol-3-phosphatase
VAGKPAVARILALVLALAAVGCGGGSAGATAPTTVPLSVSVPDFTHVVLVVFENHEASSIAGNPDAPTFNALARRYATLTNYDAVAHPSLPNYLALVSGSTQGITSDCWNCIVRARNLADALAARGKTWKTYAEDLPYPGFTGGSAGRYAKKHDPFLYFRDVVGSPARRDRVVPYPQLSRDVAAPSRRETPGSGHTSCRYFARASCAAGSSSSSSTKGRATRAAAAGSKRSRSGRP